MSIANDEITAYLAKTANIANIRELYGFLQRYKRDTLHLQLASQVVIDSGVITNLGANAKRALSKLRNAISDTATALSDPDIVNFLGE